MSLRSKRKRSDTLVSVKEPRITESDIRSGYIEDGRSIGKPKYTFKNADYCCEQCFDIANAQLKWSSKAWDDYCTYLY
jgi:hypothetical protein